MKLRNGLFIATVAGIGYGAYHMSTKIKTLKATHQEVLTFGGKQEKIVGEFEGKSYGIMFGGLDLDLSLAEMVGNEALLEVYVEFGGASIKVPDHWNVKAEGTCNQGGFADETNFNKDDLDAPLLMLKYTVKHGGLNIVNVGDSEEEVDIVEDPSFGDII
jgi:hypothetical protein